MTNPNYPYPVPPPAPRTSTAKIVAIVVAALGGLCVTGLLIGAVGAAVSGSKSNPTSALAVATTPSPPPTTARHDIPSADNLTTELTVTSKKCFGSAGCNLTYELRVVMTEPVSFDPATTYRVRIVVDRDTRWEQIHSLDLKGDRADVVTARISPDTLDTPVAVIDSVVARP